MLVVIAIIGIVAAISVPAFNNMRKADAVSAATRQLLDDLNRARQLAISQRTTVYMVFVPFSFWDNNSFPNQTTFNSLSVNERNAAEKLYDKQLIGYNFVTLRNVGDQPGQYRARYFGEWRTLPDGIFVPLFKFFSVGGTRIYDPPLPAGPTQNTYDVYAFNYTNNIPFPTADSPSGIWLPYIAFDHLGQLVSGRDLDQDIIPVARGSVSASINPQTKLPVQGLPTLNETPPGNSTNAFTLIVVERLTGRAHVERQQISGN
jgi:type II secretory pathway pseudopilin PulG